MHLPESFIKAARSLFFGGGGAWWLMVVPRERETEAQKTT